MGRDDAQQVLRYERARWRENVRVHIPTFPVTPGVSDIFRRGDIYSCFGFLSLPPFLLGTVSNGSCPPPRHSGTPNFDDMCIQSVRTRVRVTPSHRIWNEGIKRVANEARVKTESLPVLSPLLFQPAGCGSVCNFVDTMVEGAQYGAGFFAGDEGRGGGCLNVCGIISSPSFFRLV